MKKLLFILCIILLIISFTGCKSSSPSPKRTLTLKIDLIQEIINFKNLSTSSSKNISTSQNWRIYSEDNELTQTGSYLEAKVYNELGQEIIVDDSLINWSSNFDSESLLQTTGKRIQFKPNFPGKYIITAQYQDCSANIEIMSYKSASIILGNNWLNSHRGIIFATNTGTDNLEEADFYMDNMGPGERADFCAPCGVTYVESNFEDFPNTSDVSNLDFNTTQLTFIVIYDLNKTYIVKTRDGGYAKFRVNCTSFGSGSFAISIMHEYSPNGTFITF